MNSASETPQVPCPTCARRTLFAPANRWRPFCSERCRSIDLGAWASERFRVADDSPLTGTDGVDAAFLEPRLPGG